MQAVDMLPSHEDGVTTPRQWSAHFMGMGVRGEDTLNEQHEGAKVDAADALMESLRADVAARG